PSTPAQVIFQVFGCDPMKSFHPLFKSAVVGINILDMVNTSNDSNSSREIDGAMGNSEAMSHRPVDGSAITTENGIFCQDSPQRRLSCLPIQGIHHGRCRCARAVAEYQRRHRIAACSADVDLLRGFTGWRVRVTLAGE